MYLSRVLSIFILDYRITLSFPGHVPKIWSSSPIYRDCCLQHPLSCCRRDSRFHRVPRPESLQAEYLALPGAEGRNPSAERGTDTGGGFRSSAHSRRNTWPHWIWYVSYFCGLQNAQDTENGSCLLSGTRLYCVVYVDSPITLCRCQI